VLLKRSAGSSSRWGKKARIAARERDFEKEEKRDRRIIRHS